MRDLKNTATLVLNASYEPLGVVNARRAFTSVMKGIATVEKTYPFSIHTGYNRRAGTIVERRVPHVIRLIEYRRIPVLSRTLSRKAIMVRDHHTCQYCGKAPVKLTLDHIFPESRGGQGTWENLVACCFPCNNRKANRTPEEAGMPLARRPKPFTVHTSRHLLRQAALQQDAWQEFLFFKNSTPQISAEQIQ